MKRKNLQFADGTRIWINSQSKLAYPRTFNGSTRNIYVQGEVYAEVAHNEASPFIVSANDFDLTVLGTKFNITSYKSTNLSDIVLVEGSVEVRDKNNQTTRLLPNDLLSIKDGSVYQQQQVDTEGYTSWINGLLILKGEKLSVITQKLSLYLGVNIHCDPSIADKKIWGKLDLKDELYDMLMCMPIPIKIQNIDNEFYIKEK